VKEKDIEELKRRGFDVTQMPPQKPYRKKSFEIDYSVSLTSLLILIAVILFIIMLLFIPQCIYYFTEIEYLF